LGWLKPRELEIRSVYCFQGSVARIFGIVASSIAGLAKHHLRFMLTK